MGVSVKEEAHIYIYFLTDPLDKKLTVRPVDIIVYEQLDRHRRSKHTK